MPPSRLYRKCRSRGFSPRVVAEVGVWSPARLNVAAFLEDGAGGLLVEADPERARVLQEHFRANPLVRVAACAVAARPGRVTLYRQGESTFLDGLPASPARVNEAYQPRAEDGFAVEAVTFDQLDDGAIELLSIDIEGAEWFVLQHLVSRPGVLSIETHGRQYRNPYLAEIRAWLAAHGYRLWYKGKTDSVYVLGGSVAVTAADRAVAGLTELYLRWRAWRYARRAARRPGSDEGPALDDAR